MDVLFEQFEKMMLHDVEKNNSCIEIQFSVNHMPEYSSCWLGKMPDLEIKKAVYWFGLVEDGSQAYEYYSIREFTDAKIFYGKNIKEIWNSITLLSIDGCDVEYRIKYYLDKM